MTEARRERRQRPGSAPGIAPRAVGENAAPALQEAVRLLAERRNLSREQAEAAFVDLLQGRASEAQIAALLIGLRVKGETVDELAGCAGAMRRHAVRIRSRHPELMDTCGTGGDGRSTANVSTLAALVVAGAGMPVAKHGNRSISSRCGSADLLEALGVKIDLEPDRARRCLDETGIGFLFAPRFHPAMKHALPVRRALGVRTILNLLGPLSNPADITRQLIGVFDAAWLRPFAEVLHEAGLRSALIVHGNGMDELHPRERSRVAELRDSRIREYVIDPVQAGVRGSVGGELRVSGIEQSVRVARQVLNGEQSLVSEAVVFNAGAALYAAARAGTIREGVELARRSLRDGAARDMLERLISSSNGPRQEGRSA